MYEDLTSGKHGVDLSPSQALDGAESSLVGRGYVVMQRTAATLTVGREDSEGPAEEEVRPKVVVMAAPQSHGG